MSAGELVGVEGHKEASDSWLLDYLQFLTTGMLKSSWSSCMQLGRGRSRLVEGTNIAYISNSNEIILVYLSLLTRTGYITSSHDAIKKVLVRPRCAFSQSLIVPSVPA